MAAITVAYTAPDAARGAPNKPVTTGLVMDIWNSVDFVKQWLGDSYYAGAVKDHSHDGVDSSLISVGSNYVRNGSFEDGTTGWTFTDYATGSHAVSTSNHRDGAKCIEFTSTVVADGGGYAVSNEYQPISEGEYIPLKYWVWASVAGISSKLEVIWYDNGKALLSTTVVRSFTSTLVAANNYADIAVAPSGARFMRIKITGGIPAIGTATGVVRFDGITRGTSSVDSAVAKIGVPISVFKVGALGLAQNTTAYMSALGRAADATESNVEQTVVKPFTMKELRVIASAAVPAANSVVFTVRKNGADTALTCTIAATTTAASDTTHSVNFSLGDKFAIKVVSSATAGTNDYTATVRQRKLDRDVGLPVLHLAAGIPASGTMGDVNINVGVGSGQGRQIPVPACVASIWLAAKVTTANNPATIFRNNAAEPTLTTALSGSSSPSATYYAFDEMDMLSARTAGAYTATGCIYLESADPLKHDPCPLVFSSIAQAQATTRYMAGYVNGTVNANEAKVQVPVPACRIKNLRAELDATPAAGQTMTVTVRKNGVDTGLTCQITNGGGQIASDLLNEVTFAAGDLLSVSAVSSATVGTRDLSISIELFV